MKIKLRVTSTAGGAAEVAQRFGLCLLFLLLAPTTLLLSSWSSPGLLSNQATLRAAAAAPEATTLRRFYLSKDTAVGATTTFTCQPGYHFASLWELSDITKLHYEGDEEYSTVTADAGQGPPVAAGWVRTGRDSASVAKTTGAANCGSWSNATADAAGTTLRLRSDWEAAGGAFSLWTANTAACNTKVRVWCVEDGFPDIGTVYLPQISSEASFR